MIEHPRFHITAPRNWLNDPNGPIYWNGRYHVFYQHNPSAPRWGNIHWGHTSSPDLVNWTDHGIALTPSAGADSDGCWSGCAQLVDGRPTFFYTGVSSESGEHFESVCRAYGDGELSALVNDPRGALISPTDREPGHRQYRDPFVLRDEVRDRWLMLLGTGISLPGRPRAGAVVAYESADCSAWTYLGTIFSLPEGADARDVGPGGAGPEGVAPIDTGPVWECPQLMRFGDDWVLVVSVQMQGETGAKCPYAVWFVGDFDGFRFEARRSGYVDGGDVFYAPTVFMAPDGRTLMWGWLQETADAAVLDEAGFAGAFSLPRSVELRDGRLVTAPVAELDAAWRETETSLAHVRLDESDPALALGEGGSYRLRFTLDTENALAGVRVLERVDGERTVVAVDGRGDDVRLMVRRDTGLESQEIAAMVLPDPGGKISLDLIADGTILEVFTASGASLTTRVYPRQGDDDTVHLTALEGSAGFSAVELSRPRVLDFG